MRELLRERLSSALVTRGSAGTRPCWRELPLRGRESRRCPAVRCDRRTDLIISGGANVYSAEVEAALTEHPPVLTCAVIGLPDDDLGQRVHAIIQADTPVADTDLRAFLGERLAR